MYEINKRYRLHWELQLNDEFRWHVWLHRTDSCTEPPTHVMLVAEDNTYEYRPFDRRVIDRLRMITLWSRDPVRWVRTWQAEAEEKQLKLELADEDEMEQHAKHYRRLFARLATAEGNPDSYWVGGISKKDGGGYELDPEATPKSRKVTTVVAGEKRA